MEEETEYDITDEYYEKIQDENERASLDVVQKNGKTYITGLGI